MTVGTQAAVLAGLDVTMFIEFQPPANEEWVSSISIDKRLLSISCVRLLRAALCYWIFIVI